MIAQIDWIISYRPEWLGVVGILFGIWLLLYGSILSDEVLKSVPKNVITVSVVVVPFLIPWIITKTVVFSTPFLLIGSWIEGIAAVRFYSKVYEFFRKDKNSNFLNKRKKYLILVLVTGISIWAVVTSFLLLSFYGYVQYDARGQIIIIWTVISFITSLLGITWKLYPEKETINKFRYAGLVLIVASSAIANQGSIRINVVVFLLTEFVYVMGYLFGITVLIKEIIK